MPKRKSRLSLPRKKHVQAPANDRGDPARPSKDEWGHMKSYRTFMGKARLRLHHIDADFDAVKDSDGELHHFPMNK